MILNARFSEIFNRPIPLPAILETEIPIQNILKKEYVERFWQGLDLFIREMDLGPKSRRPKVQTAKLFSMEGELSKKREGVFSIQGAEFSINQDTFVIGNLCPNVTAKVKGLRFANGECVATSVCVK